ncbi:M23 family metallopeptidase [Novosphingobium huizhouense]|uniref:M23 family metallopeptidase n=1 Tax=Novosphingobium huizhouense TaxID=2866625 RepID=UPI001CD8BAC6|nr:M23 family metallopeptidase [Novosphingobium huizhouense]
MFGRVDQSGAAAAVATFGRARPGPGGAPSHPVRQRLPLAVVEPESETPPAAPQPRLASRLAGHPLVLRWDALRRSMEARASRLDLAPDLAEDVGSARWFRGLATFLSLTLLAAAFWPDFAPLEAAPLVRLDDGARAEFAAQALTPARRGATGGRHFAAAPELVLRLDAAVERPEIRLAAMLGENDTVLRMLQRAGIGQGDAAQAAALIGGAVPLDSIAPGTRFDLVLGARSSPVQPRPLEAIKVRPRFDLALAVERAGGVLGLKRAPIAVDTRPLRVQGLVGASLYRSARAAGAPPETVQDYLRAVDEVLPFEEILPSDEFDFVVSYKRAADGEGQAGDLQYAAILRDGRPRLQLLRWGNDGAFQSLDALTGAQGANDDGALLTPVAGHVTSGFGLRRHPILGFVRMHAGIDFAAAWGSPIYAATDGRVSFAGWHGGHGNYVRLDHGGGIGTGYGHMSRIAVVPGMTVRRGQVIGYVGSTGLSTGPHLHYELYRGGQVVDPASVRFLARRQAADPGQIAAFKARLAQMTALRANVALR